MGHIEDSVCRKYDNSDMYSGTYIRYSEQNICLHVWKGDIVEGIPNQMI